ncbi:MAG TPA: substrate-binding domain-containing protein [Actinomycetota bacterium]|nr:substrate-binding domain-containing protein [Actinomycetota bacterium]
MRRKWLALAALVAAFALVAAACGGNNDTSGGGNGDAARAPDCLNFADLYALIGPESEGFDNWSDAEALAQQVDGLDSYPDAPLTITAPGEESGTYDSFIELALAGVAETRLESGDITEDQVETTRPDYQASPNDNVIIEGIAGSEASLGWVGFSFYEQNRDVVRAIEIDGGDGCVEPTVETIGDGSYPISRSLYIYVNTAKAADNPALQAFVDFYLTDAGIRESVSEVGYVTLPDDRIAATQATWESEGPGTDTSGDLSGELFMSGSSTVEPISALVAELFNADHPDVAINVEGPGTGDGFELFCNGETDISDASRQIKDEEAAACADTGIEYVELEVGIDGISVLTQAG